MDFFLSGCAAVAAIVVQNSLMVQRYFFNPDFGVVRVFTAGECVDPLVSGLYASSFLASSRYNFLYSANFAKLYGKLLLVM